jgi:hypothetical protein
MSHGVKHVLDPVAASRDNELSNPRAGATAGEKVPFG